MISIKQTTMNSETCLQAAFVRKSFARILVDDGSATQALSAWRASERMKRCFAAAPWCEQGWRKCNRSAACWLIDTWSMLWNQHRLTPLTTAPAHEHHHDQPHEHLACNPRCTTVLKLCSEGRFNCAQRPRREHKDGAPNLAATQ